MKEPFTCKEVMEILTGKDAKTAYALTERIVEESRSSDHWYSHWDYFAQLLEHPNSLVRNRAIAILAANVRWDGEGRLDRMLDAFLAHTTDSKPITARKCIQSIPEIASAKPELIPRIREKLEHADLRIYRDSMQQLILQDIAGVLARLDRGEETL